MEVFEKPRHIENLSLALGFFDGVHLAHRAVLGVCVAEARKSSMKSAVVTFKQHPLHYLKGYNIEYVTSFESRIEKISEIGVDYLFTLDLYENIFKLSAEEYLQKVLVENFRPKFIVTGFNHTFGKSKTGDSHFLAEHAIQYPYKYDEIAPIYINNILVSSTNIRKYLLKGDLKTANSLLGYNFELKGIVKEGEKIGQTLGFPTANLDYPEHIVKLPCGVYIAEVTLDKTYLAVVNWGCRPTINPQHNPLLEVHILDFDKNIYGESLTISFIQKLRDERKFANPDELKSQIHRDILQCKKFFN